MSVYNQNENLTVQSHCINVATYACDTWKITAKVAQKLHVFHQQCLHKLLRTTYLCYITNEKLLKRARYTGLQDIVAEIPHPMSSRSSAFQDCNNGYQPEEHVEEVIQKITWRTFQEDMGRVHLKWNKAGLTASVWSYWQLATSCCPMCSATQELQSEPSLSIQ